MRNFLKNSNNEENFLQNMTTWMKFNSRSSAYSRINSLHLHIRVRWVESKDQNPFLIYILLHEELDFKFVYRKFGEFLTGHFQAQVDTGKHCFGELKLFKVPFAGPINIFRYSESNNIPNVTILSATLICSVSKWALYPCKLENYFLSNLI